MIAKTISDHGLNGLVPAFPLHLPHIPRRRPSPRSQPRAAAQGTGAPPFCGIETVVCGCFRGSWFRGEEGGSEGTGELC